MLLRSREMYLDTTRVLRNMALLNTTIMPMRIRRGLTLAGGKFMSDTVIGLPTTPIKRPGYGLTDPRVPGELRASGALFVDGVKKQTTQKLGEAATGKFQPTVYGGTPIRPLSHEACVVFNAPYAAIQHEAFPEKSAKSEGAGTHYMSEKLYGNAVEYIAIIARAIRL